MRRCKKDAKVLKMDLTHIKYAVEVERTKSITRAAENLFMGQPNLSRSIREWKNPWG
jgi:DNA-binding transcriptional LysR family regulator